MVNRKNRRVVFNCLTKVQVIILLFGLLVVSAIFAQAQTEKIWLEINSNPKCGTDDICHKVVNLPKDGTAFDELKSAFFYVVILKTVKKCGVTEKERLKKQALFPKNKVFASTTDCDLAEDNVSYENINEDDYGFIAVYVGKTKLDAEKFLKTITVAEKFPGANIRKTRLVLSGT